MSKLTAIANTMGTDKGTQAGAAHGYSLIYEMFFAPMRSLPRVDILEMGLAIGGPELGGEIGREVLGAPSVEAWLRYFDNAHIVGFDISDFSGIVHERFRFVRGDAGRRGDLEKIVALKQHFDIIVDDASHASYHQQLALAVLFNQLKPGGLYIIEDLGWQPKQLERELPAVPLTSELLSEFVATGDMPVTAAVDGNAARMLEHNVGAVNFFEESLLHALGDSYNHRMGLSVVKRQGWRGKHGAARALSPRFWLYVIRRMSEGIRGREFVNAKSTKLVALQKTTG